MTIKISNRQAPMIPLLIALTALAGPQLALAQTSSAAKPAVTSASVALTDVTVLRLPAGGLQPCTVTDAAGTLHVVYFRGKPEAGDIFYAAKKAGEPGWAKPIRINSQEGSAVAVGTIRGPRLTLGRGGRVHVAWNGSSTARPRGPKGGIGSESDPMLYARMTDAMDSFEPQRCVATIATALDGGGSIAADLEGRVFVGWHGAGPEGPEDEAARRFWVAVSTDDGATFAPERAVSPVNMGACACCGTAAMTDATGGVQFLFRAAGGNENRDMQWLHSADHGRTFAASNLHAWNVNQCPMSTAWIAPSSDASRPVVLAWETKGQVYFARANPKAGEVSSKVAPSRASENRKHPAVATDPQGRVLMVWTEGTGWNKGGMVAWEVFGEGDKPLADTYQCREGHKDGIEVWNSVAAACADGRFVVVY